MGSDYTILHSYPAGEIESKWRNFLARADIPSLYTMPEFFLERFWKGKRPFAVLALADGEVEGVLTGMHEDQKTVSGLMSRPQVCLARNATSEAAAALARGVIAEAGEDRLISVFSWSSTPLDAFARRRFRVRQYEGDVVLDLRQGAKALYAQIHKKCRTDIRYAIKKGVEVRPAATREDAAAYYEMRMGWHKRKNLPLPDDTADAILRRIAAGNRLLLLAVFEQKIIAASAFRFCPGGMIEYGANCSWPEFQHVKPNDLLQLHVIEWACERGFQRYSLGGAHFFLRKFGGTVEPIVRYRLDRTFLRREDLRDALSEKARGALRSLPTPIKYKVKRLLKR